MKCTLFTLLCLVQLTGFAATEFTYDVQIRLVALSQSKVDQFVSSTMQMSATDPNGKREETLRKAFTGTKEINASESFVFENNNYFAKMVTPTRSGVFNKEFRYIANVDKIEYSKSDLGNFVGSVIRRTRFIDSADRIVFANANPSEFKILKSAVQNGKRTIEIELEDQIVELFYDSNTVSKLILAKCYRKINGERAYHWLRYNILEHQQFENKSIPKTIVVTQVKLGTDYDKWTYSLTSAKKVNQIDPTKMFGMGDNIVDNRLGESNILTYQWEGALPTIEQLRQIKNKNERPILGVASASTAVWAGVGLLLGAIGFAVIRHKSVEAKK